MYLSLYVPIQFCLLVRLWKDLALFDFTLLDVSQRGQVKDIDIPSSYFRN